MWWLIKATSLGFCDVWWIIVEIDLEMDFSVSSKSTKFIHEDNYQSPSEYIIMDFWPVLGQTGDVFLGFF